MRVIWFEGYTAFYNTDIIQNELLMYITKKEHIADVVGYNYLLVVHRIQGRLKILWVFLTQCMYDFFTSVKEVIQF